MGDYRIPHIAVLSDLHSGVGAAVVHGGSARAAIGHLSGGSAATPTSASSSGASTGCGQVVRVATDIVNGRLRTPGRIPEKVQMIKEAEVPPPIAITGGVIGGVPGGIPGGQLGGVIGGIVNATPSFAAVPKLSKPAPVVQRVRVSQGVTKGMVVYRIEPTYPPLARQARIQGVVVLTAMIDRDGNIQNLRLVSGHPMLAPAAIDAVKHWRYKPFLLNGQPVEVETTVTVTFQLQM